MADFGDKLTNFNLKSYYKIKNIYKKVPSNKTKHVEGGKNLNELSEKVKLLSTKGYDCLLGGRISQSMVVMKIFSFLP